MLLYDPVYRKNIIESTFHYYTAQTMNEVTVSLYTLIVRMHNFFTCNLQNRKFMLLIKEDIHFIHAKHHPKSSVTSTICHMCTTVVHVQVNMRVVKLEEDVTKYQPFTSDHGGWGFLRPVLPKGFNINSTMLFLNYIFYYSLKVM